MKHNKHTPRPWKSIGVWEDGNIRIVPCDAYGNSRSDGPICDVLCINKGSFDNDAITEANADLIVASPDLLDACKKALTCRASMDSSVVAVIEAAIRKTKGELK